MGMLVDGQWTDDDGPKYKGSFKRHVSPFRSMITADGSSDFPAEAGRYHLYITRSCPWAHRTLLLRGMKQLQDLVGLTLLGLGDQGYAFNDGEHIVPGTDHKLQFLHEIYALADNSFTGRITVPTLWDSKAKTIVSNESSEIARMFNSAFDGLAPKTPDYYPEHLRGKIDEMNDYVYANFNNGVYRAGFSAEQAAYEKAYDDVFMAMDRMDEILGGQRYLCGNQITEADWRAFPTLTRFDNAYHYVFKCNKKRLRDYENLWPYTRDLYQQPGVADLVFPEAIKGGYWSGARVNPLGTIPKGPEGINFNEPHGREAFG